jgi:O-antigen/teichoic acid export membrane protein
MVVSTLLVLLLYKYISSQLGVDALGVWSVMLAGVSAARLSEFGLTAAVTRFVAIHGTNGDRSRIPLLVGTALITLFIGISILLPIFYILLLGTIPYVFSEEYRPIAVQILPYALFSFWLSTLSGVLLSALDGLQSMVARSYIFMLGQAIFTIVGMYLVGHFAILGLAYAQIVQGIFLFIAGCFVLKRLLREYSLFNYRFSMEALREMFNYGANVQASVFFMTMLDPITKALISRYGGPTSAGYFEIANQIVSRARAFVTVANQAVIPHIAALNSQLDDVVSDFYSKNIQIVAYVAFPMFGILLSWSPIFSHIILGELNIEFISIFGIVGLGWLANLFASPSYFINQGVGRVKVNTTAIGVMSALNIVLGILLGHLFGSSGVVIAYSGSISAGSALLIVIAKKNYGAGIDRKAIHSNRHLFIAFLFSCISLMWCVFADDINLMNLILLTLSTLFVIHCMIRHPFFSAYVKPLLLRS